MGPEPGGGEARRRRRAGEGKERRCWLLAPAAAATRVWGERRKREGEGLKDGEKRKRLDRIVNNESCAFPRSATR